jgi:hypothetical protein
MVEDGGGYLIAPLLMFAQGMPVSQPVPVICCKRRSWIVELEPSESGSKSRGLTIKLELTTLTCLLEEGPEITIGT